MLPSDPPPCVTPRSSADDVPGVRVILNQDGYPDVQFWDQDKNQDRALQAIQVTGNNSDSDSDLSDGSSDDSEAHIKKQKKKSSRKSADGVFAFLENADGTTWTPRNRAACYSTARKYWNENFTASNLPKNFSSVGIQTLEKYRIFLESRFPELRLCSDSWKADKVWKLNYHSWKLSFEKSIKKQAAKAAVQVSAAEASSSSEGSKKKRIQPEDGNESGDGQGKSRKKSKRVDKGKAVCVLVARAHCYAVPSLMAYLRSRNDRV